MYVYVYIDTCFHLKRDIIWLFSKEIDNTFQDTVKLNVMYRH